MADDDDVTDRDLLAQWAGGDKRSGDRLTQKYFARIRQYFVRRVPQEYEDLVLETFLQLSRSKNNYRGEASVRVFIYSIARNVLRDHIRKRKPAYDPLTTSLREAWGRRPSSILAEQEHHRILLEALQEVPSTDQDLLELYYWKNLTGPELAALFEVPEGTVRGRLRAARKRLSEKYEEIAARGASDSDISRWLGEVSDDDDGGESR